MRYLNIDRVTIVSIGFLLLFIAFNSASNLSSQALKNDGFDKLGFYTMATLYFFFAVFSFFSTAIVNKMGSKLSLFVGGLCYSFWIFCFLPPAFYIEHKDSDAFIYKQGFIYFLLLFSAAINGFGAGILWVAEGKYVADCANDENRGFFFGYFWAFFMSSQILGNMIAGLILGNLSQSTYYIIMTVVAFSGTFFFLLLRQPIKQLKFEEMSQHSDQDLPIKDTDKLLKIERDSKRPEAIENDFINDIKETFRLLISRKMLFVIPLIVWTAFSQAIYSGSFVPLMNNTMASKDWTSDEKLAYSLFAMIPLGLGEVIGGLLIGKLLDKYGPKITIFYVMAVTAVAFALLFALLGVYEFGVLTFFCTFTWGFQDTSVVNFCNCILGFEFDSKIIPFSVYKFVQSIFTFIFLVAESYITSKTDYLIYFIVVAVYAFISIAIMLLFNFKERTPKKSDDSVNNHQ